MELNDKEIGLILQCLKVRHNNIRSRLVYVQDELLKQVLVDEINDIGSLVYKLEGEEKKDV